MKWVVVFGSATVFIFADFLAYKWSHNKDWRLLLAVMVLGAIGYAGFAVVCTFVPLGSTPMVGITVAAGAAIVGYLCFGEWLNWSQLLGLLCVFAGFVLLSWHDPKLPPVP